MKKILLTSVFLGCFFLTAKPGDVFYKVADIPAELKENARSVVRNDARVFIVTDINKATLQVSFAITVLNKNGLEDANFKYYYDKFESVSSIKGRMFDENGVQIRKINSEDIQDLSAIAGYSVYEDNRIKYIDPGIRQYPFTVEYYFEVEFKGILGYPSWFPIDDYNISVEKSSFKALVPGNMEFRYFESNIPVTVSTTTSGLNTIYQWELSNLKAIKWEPLAPSPREYFPMVLMAPADFEIAGYKGNASTWDNFGDWVYSLTEGKDVLNPETVAELNEMVKDCRNDNEKICTVYQYMQGRVRYVNLTIGIGGWQPIDAATVHRLGYGDCKALTNYMKAMLKVIGINSYYCPVMSGESAPDLITSFPSAQFNHIILCVPVEKDTIWLECTNQHLPCGYLGGFTENRHALLVDKSNSRLIMTNERQGTGNAEVCSGRISFDETGKGSLDMTTDYSGMSYDDILPAFLSDDKDKKKIISERIIFPAFEVIDFKYTETRSANPSIEESININFENYLTSINSKYLLPLNCTNRITNSPASSRNRKVDVVIRHAFVETDSLLFLIPPTLKVESLPDPVDISGPFGSYKSSVVIEENNLIYIRTFQIEKGIHPASSYPDLVDFFDKITMADDEKCVLVSIE
jgi:transglutaminase-like putative cysteine protease